MCGKKYAQVSKRWLIVVHGRQLELTVDAVTHELALLAAIPIWGETVECELDPDWYAAYYKLNH